jgi:hypothetical protein
MVFIYLIYVFLYILIAAVLQARLAGKRLFLHLAICQINPSKFVIYLFIQYIFNKSQMFAFSDVTLAHSSLNAKIF